MSLAFLISEVVEQSDLLSREVLSDYKVSVDFVCFCMLESLSSVLE